MTARTTRQAKAYAQSQGSRRTQVHSCRDPELNIETKDKEGPAGPKQLSTSPADGAGPWAVTQTIDQPKSSARDPDDLKPYEYYERQERLSYV